MKHAPTPDFIVVDAHQPIAQGTEHQSEAALEQEFVADLVALGYEYREDLKTKQDLLRNIRIQLEVLNQQALSGRPFSDAEWQRFCDEYLDKPSEGWAEKTHKLHNDTGYDLVLDDNRLLQKNIRLVDTEQPQRNKLQVIRQFWHRGADRKRYDVTILVNGLPLVQVELKKRSRALREGFGQIDAYRRESFNDAQSLYQYLQLLCISNGTDTRYFANGTRRSHFSFTMHWASCDNKLIKDLKDFTATFFQPHTLLGVLLRYAVFDTSQRLLIMRPYQIAAVERLLWRIQCIHAQGQWGSANSGGYVWHTTGSGKTLSSFKAARLATALPFVDKVFFVVDRKDLDFQTMKEYQRFSPDSVQGSQSVQKLKALLANDDQKIMVTTIQKLNHLMKSEEALPIYGKNVVFIFDECHRSQFGQAQRNLKKRFQSFCQFGFTGTPIFKENALGDQTTAGVFGDLLHTYGIADAIRDDKVLPFKVDYHNVRPIFSPLEAEQNIVTLRQWETEDALLQPERIKAVASHVLDCFAQKTHRRHHSAEYFNALFAVESIDAAQKYYQQFKELQQERTQRGIEPLKIATIFSFAPDYQDAMFEGDIQDESFEEADLGQMGHSAKAFLREAIADYNAYFQSNDSVEDSQGFQNYYRNLSQRVKACEIDLLIVVGMFLTGFDAPRLNTLFVDKNLRYHGLIQAYSRTNRIFNVHKAFGNIVTYRNLEKATKDALTLFGQTQDEVATVVLERTYDELMLGYIDAQGRAQPGYVAVLQQLRERFPSHADIVSERDKKAFVELFGQYLRLDNKLRMYDEYEQWHEQGAASQVQAYSLSEPGGNYCVYGAPLNPRQEQNYRSTYHDISDWFKMRRIGEQPTPVIDWSDVVFEIELLNSVEINVDYISALIFQQQHQPREQLVEQIRSSLRASAQARAKEALVVEFLSQAPLHFARPEDVSQAFTHFAKLRLQASVQAYVEQEGLNADATWRYVNASLKHGFASASGEELPATVPNASPLAPSYQAKRERIWQTVSNWVDTYKDIGVQLDKAPHSPP